MAKRATLRLLALAIVVAGAAPLLADFTAVSDWLKLPAGRPQLGNMHGDIAVSSKGEVFVSVQDPAAGLQVYAPDGTFQTRTNDDTCHGCLTSVRAGHENGR